MFRRVVLACVVPVVLVMIGCAATKSEDPLSPTVAGPIPGVNITPPTIVQPTTGARVSVDQQPVVLMVNNAASSGVRPLTYVFEIAADVSFANKVFSRDGIQPGGTGQTSLRLPDALATGRTYFWHARAEDGANTGPFSSTAAFDVFTPIVIGAPVPTSPIDNAMADSAHPRFAFNNAPRSGPVGAIGVHHRGRRQRQLREQAGRVDGGRAGRRPDGPRLATGPAAHQAALLACPRLRSDDGRAVVGHAGVPDAGARSSCRRRRHRTFRRPDRRRATR